MTAAIAFAFSSRAYLIPLAMLGSLQLAPSLASENRQRAHACAGREHVCETSTRTSIEVESCTGVLASRVAIRHE